MFLSASVLNLLHVERRWAVNMQTISHSKNCRGSQRPFALLHLLFESICCPVSETEGNLKHFSLCPGNFSPSEKKKSTLMNGRGPLAAGPRP